MDFDYTPYFKQYEELVTLADQVFERMVREFPDAVTCKAGCADCCHALFDVTLIEAIYINHRFNARYSGPGRESLLERANRADRAVAKIKRRAMQQLREGTDEATILHELARVQVRCPLLNTEDRCDLYAHRPLTCRFYGIPTSINGEGHTCGLSGFEPGQAYPTVNMDRLFEQLQRISAEMLRDMRSRYIKLADMLVPLSMALLTLYDDEYLGMEADRAPQRHRCESQTTGPRSE
jgi:Fe-S-cluster containining protein